MLQTGALIRDVTVRELVGMLASLYPQPLDPDEVLDLARVGAIADRRTHKLSGGQAQRALFALAMVSDPRLLVLDEPTDGMDVESRRAFWEVMRAFASRGRTVIFATHYLDEAETYADRVVLMAQGRVVADGATTEIRARLGRRTISATVPGVDIAALRALPGVIAANRRGSAVTLTCSDSDSAIRGLIAAHPRARDIDISSAGLEDAFLELTAEDRDPAVATV